VPENPVWVARGTPAVTSTPVDVMERASPDVFTTITADPGTGGTTLAVTLRDRFPQAANFKVRVDNEVMLVTAGFGTGAGSFTVTRAQDGTVAAVHTVGVVCSLIVGVQRIDPVDGGRQVTFKGRACTFRTPGRAGTTGQKLFALHNATASPVLVDCHNIMIDSAQAVSKGATVLPPLMRLYKFTAVPSGGTQITKNGEDASLTSKSQVTVWGDASATGDGTVAATPLTIAAITNGSQSGLITQMFAPRLLGSATGTNPTSELIDVATFFAGEDETITLRALEGLAVHLDYTVATQNAAADMWTVACRWVEYSAA
jgi:hypothetical protein